MSKEKNLDFIMSIIERMSKNSFSLKGWTIALLSAMFVLSRSETNKVFLIFALIPIVCFWLLDSYYLFKERQYRELFNNINNNDFKEKISLTIKKDKKNFKQWLKCAFSKTEIIFYLPLIFSIIITFIIYFRKI